jgi:hypothetical protein
MHTLLIKYLAKQGLTFDTMSDEEKKTYDTWNKTLSNTKLTVDDIRRFCEVQKTFIEDQFGELDNSGVKNDRLVLLHTVYSKIARATEADKKEREGLEKYLTSLIDNTST